MWKENDNGGGGTLAGLVLKPKAMMLLHVRCVFSAEIKCPIGAASEI